MSSSASTHVVAAEIPPNFKNVVFDMTADLSTTFPEYASVWTKWQNPSQDELRELYTYCSEIYPERFFDILYQNDSLFTKREEENKKSTFFLPGMDFRILYHDANITDTTKSAIWKYLQLMLFTIAGTIKDKTCFGTNTAQMFANIDESAFNSKLTETISSLSDFFSNLSDPSKTPEGGGEEAGEESSGEDGGKAGEEAGEEAGDAKTVPSFEELFGHLKGLFDGKIGKLAQELAEEISGDINQLFDKSEFENATNSADILKQMMKDPSKIKELVRIVSEKLSTKMRNGEISQDELMKEIAELLGKMKNAAGSKGGNMDFNSMFTDILANLGSKLPKNAKLDLNAIQKLTTRSSICARMREKVILKRAKEAEDAQQRLLDYEQRQRDFINYFPETTTLKASLSSPPPAAAPATINLNPAKNKKKKNKKTNK